MRFPPSFLEDIKARLPVSEVVRHRVKLKKSGREYVGLSPFGSERTPSFFVNDQKMAWFDFSSGKNGNIFDFVMATEGLTFPETVERLAQDAGLALPARTPESEQQERARAGLHEILEWAAAYFESHLGGPLGVKASAYLDGRGIGASSRGHFRIGYAPGERHGLRDALAAKGASVTAMCEAGLLIHGEGIPVPYDRFRDRVMFPIADRHGRTIAFGGRALGTDVQAKYLNSPETPLFRKGTVLFNHHRARQAAHDKGRVIAVEGYIDVIAMHAAGFPETVAPLGTALTEDQMGLLWTLALEPVLCFDGDKAGRKAAYRAVDTALPLIGPKRTFSFALLPDGKDPDELIRAAGAEAMRDALAAARPMVDLVWARVSDGRPLRTPEHRAGLERDLETVTGMIRDEPLRRQYRDDFRERRYQLFRTQRRPSDRPNSRTKRTGRAPEEPSGYLSSPVSASASLTASPTFKASGLSPREALIMVILIAHPELVEEYSEALAALEFAAEDASRLRDRLLDLVQDQAERPSPVALRRELVEGGLGTIVAKIERSGAAARWYARPDAAVQDSASVLRQALILHHEGQILQTELAAARDTFVADPNELNWGRIRDLQAQLKSLLGKEAAIEGFGSPSGRATGSL